MADLVKMTDELAGDIARRFGVTPEYVWEQYRAAQEAGPEAALADMDRYMGDVEEEIEGVLEVATDHLATEPRNRGMANFYQEVMDALDDPERMPDTTDLLMKLSVALYKLAEAQQRIAELSDGQHRTRREP